MKNNLLKSITFAIVGLALLYMAYDVCGIYLTLPIAGILLILRAAEIARQ
jgi:hypothetical protein